MAWLRVPGWHGVVGRLATATRRSAAWRSPYTIFQLHEGVAVSTVRCGPLVAVGCWRACPNAALFLFCFQCAGLNRRPVAHPRRPARSQERVRERPMPLSCAHVSSFEWRPGAANQTPCSRHAVAVVDLWSVVCGCVSVAVAAAHRGHLFHTISSMPWGGKGEGVFLGVGCRCCTAGDGGLVPPFKSCWLVLAFKFQLT